MTPEHDATAPAAGVVRFHAPPVPAVKAFLEDARAIVESGWLSGGEHVRRLERAVAPWVGTDRVVAVSSGTGGLIAALSVFGEPGAEAIIPLTAALALRNLEGYERQLLRREAIHRRYVDAWAGLPLRLSTPRPGERSTHKDQLVWLDEPERRRALRDFLTARGVETRPYYEIAVPDLQGFEGNVASAEQSRSLAARSFAVPIHARLTDQEVEQVAAAMLAFFR